MKRSGTPQKSGDTRGGDTRGGDARSGDAGVFKHPLAGTPVSAQSSAASNGLQNRAKLDKNTLGIAGSNSGKPVSKALSRSHDNLASQLRKKAAAAALDGKSGGGKAKHGKTLLPDSTPIRKAHSSQTINKPEDNELQRTQSAQNISSVAKPEPVKPASKPASVPKRAVSTQNISNKAKSRHARISASNANALVYNAELLASFEKEKKSFERLVSDLRKESENRRTEIECLKIELKQTRERMTSDKQLDSLKQETQSLRAKLVALGESVDKVDQTVPAVTERGDKQPSGSSDAALKDTHDPAASTLGTCDVDSELAYSIISDLSCHTPELHPNALDAAWDRTSNKSDSLSEISVACLQDRISQMEETHYSTNEELQATLHELKDLQDSVNELAEENERLNDEKAILLESLCAQTEKLEKYRMQIEHLKQLLVSESEAGDRSREERELVSLIEMGQQEKEELLLRQIELSTSLHGQEKAVRELKEVVRTQQERLQVVELKHDSAVSDKRALERQLTELREQSAKEQIEASRMRTLLENEKQKVLELEQYQNATDKSDIEALLDNTRQEKERLEERLANKQEEVEMTRNEVVKLRERLQSCSEEMKVLKNNTKSEVHDFAYRMERKEKERQDLQEEISTLREHIDTLQLDCDRYLEERRTHTTVVHKLEADLKAAKQKSADAENEAKELKSKYSEEQGEWKQLHTDLLTTVVIANDIKTEAQEHTERMAAENAFLRDRHDALNEEVRALQAELERARREREVSGIRGRVINTVDRELQNLRRETLRDAAAGGAVGGKSMVKQLIHSIEEQVKNPPPPPSPGSPTATCPLSPTMPTLEAAQRRNSTESIKSSSDRVTGSPDPRLGPEAQYKALLRNKDGNKESRASLTHRHTISNIIYESAPSVSSETRVSPPGGAPGADKKSLPSILKEPSSGRVRHGSFGDKEKSPEKQVLFGGGGGGGASQTAAHGLKSDPLAILAKIIGGSKRNALLKWCQQKTASYPGIDITNFSSSWNDGLAFCAMLHSYLPDQIPFKELTPHDKLRNFTLAFKAGESVNIPSFLNATDMACMERPDWQAVMSYVTSIYKHFEVDNKL